MSEEKLKLVSLDDGQVITDFSKVFKPCDPVKQWYSAVEQNRLLITELNRRRKSIKRLVAAMKDHHVSGGLEEAIKEAEDMENELIMGLGDE